MIRTSDSPYDTRLFSEADYGLWDNLVEKSNGGTVFHQTLWLRSFGRPFAVVGCYDKTDGLVGGMCLSYQQLGMLTVVRPPYLTPYLGPVTFRTEGQYHRLLTLEKNVAVSVIGFLKTFCDFSRIPLSPNCTDTQPFQQNGFDVDIEHTYVIQLDDMDRVWNALDQDRRRKIRNGNAEGLISELSDDLTTFLPLLKHSLSAHTKELSTTRVSEIRRWYSALSAKNRAKIVFARNASDQVCAGAILVWDRKRAYYLLSGMNRDIASPNTMAWLVWECLRLCKETIGVAEFDFDGSDVPTVEVFFRGFGGRLIPRYSVTWGHPWARLVRRIWKRVGSQ